MSRHILIAAVVLIAAGPLPDVPGAINPVVTQDNIDSTICTRGWTRTIRPPVGYTQAIKRRLAAAAGVDMRSAELDHLVPLELGGAPRDPANLWLQPWAGWCGARVKDELENELNRLVCLRDMSLQQARREIATDWVAAYRAHVGHLECER